MFAKPLQVVNPDVFLVEKIVKTTKNRVQVKWLGYDDLEWVDKSSFIDDPKPNKKL